ncbi:hypothetical protein GXP67_26585 [Rhodocytophaga rosea]|uniref:Uncharacterized protein n=1 Tax=Rhodocytophaga rosea TaxID=2704465 RepID=A0A6C0GPI2_9BACT|nr:hypothetical protein [Rhodocytophaga rosea]QHT69959.1 hypothetical protein GXP67_26585 [Rhodocytophaga rosea]
MNRGCYLGKRVLLIGASKKVLNRLTLALNKSGFVTTSSQSYNQPEQIFSEFTATDFDVIALGRGVSNTHKEMIITAFSVQNPAIAVVKGLAPITELLVDQVKLACLPAIFSLEEAQVDSDSIRVTIPTACQLKVTLYYLNWLYLSYRKILQDTYTGAGIVNIPLSRHTGFISISQDGVITHVIQLTTKR